MIVPGMFINKGRTGYEILFVNNSDIIKYVEFEFYDYCWYWNQPRVSLMRRSTLADGSDMYTESANEWFITL